MRLTADRAVGLLLLLLGAGCLVETLRIKDDWSGARLMPVVTGIALVALGVAHVVARRARGRAEPAEPSDIRRVALVAALLAVYVTAFTMLGFLSATLLLLLVLVRLLGDYRWPAVGALAVALAVVSHVVFRVWLGMPLPDGLLAR